MLGYVLSGLGIYYLGFYSYLFYKFYPNKLIKDINTQDKNKYSEF